MARDIDRALAFMTACGVRPVGVRDRRPLHQPRGAAARLRGGLTRIDSRTGRPYDCSAHFVWIGERTRQLDGAHVAWAAGIPTRSA
jgi:3-deoxy-7-phosphoheptulonate synthase